MKKRALVVIILATFLLAIAIPVLAGYYANLQVVESSGNSYDQVGLNQTLDVDYLADNGYITSTGLDTRVTSGGTAIPHMLVEERLLFATDITAYGTANLLFTMGNTALSNFAVITGYGGYVTTSDHANLELGDNFEIEFEGWIDTSSSYSSYPSVAGSNTSTEDTQQTSHTVDLPSGIEGGDLLLLLFSCRDPEAASPTVTWSSGWTELDTDDTGTSNTVVGIAYRVADGTEGGTVTVTTSVSGHSAHQTFQVTNYGGMPEISTVATDSSTVPNPPALSPSWGADFDTLWVAITGFGSASSFTMSAYPASYSDGQLAKSTSGYAYIGSARRELCTASENPGAFTVSGTVAWSAWTLGVRGVSGLVTKSNAFTAYADSGSGGRIVAQILGGSPKTVSASGLSSGEYEVKLWADSTDFGIDIDGATENSTALAGASVPDNTNDWIISIPYANCYNHTIGVNHRIRYEPDAIIVGTTLLNEETPGTYDGAITWGTNPSGVAVSISGLVSDFQPQPAGGTSQLPPAQDVAGPSGQPGWTAGIQSLTTHPLYPLVFAVSDQTNIPVPIVWVLGATLILAMVMVWMIGDRQILHQMLIALAGGGWVAFCYHMGIYPFWVIFIYAVLALAIIIGERSPTVS